MAFASWYESSVGRWERIQRFGAAAVGGVTAIIIVVVVVGADVIVRVIVIVDVIMVQHATRIQMISREGNLLRRTLAQVVHCG